ncbi:calcium/sodium antiporter [candidate division WOR-3 bacterium]|nr:calcium/sodium antiporter [candidate division WOR-3 bacterium]
MILTIILFFIGLGLLVKGSDWLVKGASKGAQALGVSPLIIGLSVIAIGTSLPELAVSVTAVLLGSGNISVGNVIGSNICNIALCLGITSIILAVPTTKDTLKKEFPIMLGIAILLWILGKNSILSRREGILFLGLFIAYFAYLMRKKKYSVLEKEKKVYPLWIEKYYWLAVIIGIIGITIGAKFMVDTGIKIAKLIGISEAVIGLTIMAFGTSLPELTVSITAAFHKEPGISLGNILGSNIINIVLVLGCVATIQPIKVDPRLFKIDIWIMLGYSIILFPLFFTGYKLSRKEGIFLLITYIIYIIYLYH